MIIRWQSVHISKTQVRFLKGLRYVKLVPGVSFCFSVNSYCQRFYYMSTYYYKSVFNSFIVNCLPLFHVTYTASVVQSIARLPGQLSVRGSISGRIIPRYVIKCHLMCNRRALSVTAEFTGSTECSCSNPTADSWPLALCFI